jgi:dolichol-phosphate mannosyltransferase
MELSVIIPVYNEEGNVRLLHERLSRTMGEITPDYELIFVNDGSRDKTIELVRELSLRDPKVRFIDFSRNFGHQIAVSAGLDHASGEYIAIIDADLQDPPELIHEMYKKAKNDGFEVVYARRAKRKGESLFKLLTAFAFYRVLARLSTVEIPLDTGDFRIMHKSVVEVLRTMPENHKFLRGQISWAGFRQTYILYDRDARHTGETKYPFSKLISLAFDGITGFSSSPLRLATITGFVTSITAFVLIILVLFVKLWGEFVGIEIAPGWASLMIAILFIGGIQLITIGILGEYIGRINDNVKHRPLYIIRAKSPTLPASGLTQNAHVG